MVLQYCLVGLTLALAGLYLARQSWQTWVGSQKGCGGGCCGKAQKGQPDAEAGLIPADQLGLRVRKVPAENAKSVKSAN